MATTDENNIRKLTRTVFRNNEIDMLMNGKEGLMKIDGVKINPLFASIVENIIGIKSKNKKEQAERIQGITEVWDESKINPAEEAKKEMLPEEILQTASDLEINIIEETKQEIKKKEANKKDNKEVKKEKKDRKNILKVEFKADKKLNLDIVFDSDIKV